MEEAGDLGSYLDQLVVGSAEADMVAEVGKAVAEDMVADRHRLPSLARKGGVRNHQLLYQVDQLGHLEA